MKAFICRIVPTAVVLLVALANAKEGWSPLGLSGGGAMFGPAISPVDPQRMLVHCDMSGAYRSDDGGHHWTLIHADQLQGNTRCRPAFHPTDPDVVFSPSGWSGNLKVSRDAGQTWQTLGDVGGTPQGEIAIDPETPERMLVGSNKTAAISRDGGKTWTRSAGVHGEVIGFCFERTGNKPQRGMFAATREGIFRSDDGGTTWQEKAAGLPWRDLRGFAGGTKHGKSRLYCTVPCKVVNGALQGGILVSTDRGESWQSAMGEGLNKDTRKFDAWAMGECVQYHQVLTSDADPLRVYAFNANTAVAVPHHTAVYRSDDGGKHWHPTYFPDPRWPGFNCAPNHTTVCDGQYYQAVPNGVAICGGQPDVLMQLGDGDCVITSTGGANWFNGDSELATPAPRWPAQKLRGAAFQNTGLVVTTTWNYYIDPGEPMRHYICYTDIGLARSLDAGATWHRWGDGDRAPWPNTCYQLAFDPDEKGLLWGAFSNIHDIPNENIISGRHNANGPGGICVSRDFGDSWQQSNTGLPVAPATSVIIDPASPRGSRTLYAGVFGHGVFKSTDHGKSWLATGAGLGSAANRRVVRVQLHQDGTLFALVTALRQAGQFVADGPGLFRSPDGGKHWAIVNAAQPLKWPKDFAVDPANSRHLLLAAADAGDETGGLYATRDAGQTWARILRQGPQHFSAAFSPFHRGWIYATLTEGSPGPALWLSQDDGATWRPFASLPFRNAQRVTFDPADPDKIYLTTFGASVLCGPAVP
ncbi:MAG: hypothetical protein NTW21_19885 [Verrucomicrobia bacterium]|nr:hypothetical protein [Verrucomicrobiota bacterium]